MHTTQARFWGAQPLYFSLWSLLFLFIFRCEYLFWNWTAFSHESTTHLFWAFITGLRFDLAVVVWLTAPFWLFYFVFPLAFVRNAKTLSVLFVVLHLPFWALNSVDIILASFVGKRMTMGNLYLFGEVQGRSAGILGPYILPMLFQTVLVCVLIYLLLRQFKKRPVFPYPLNKGRQWGLSLFTLAVLIVGSRGGLQLKPITYSDAHVFSEAALNNLCMNSTFTLLKSVGRKNIPRYHYFPGPTDYNAYLNWRPQQARAAWAENIHFEKSPNIVLIVLEGINLEYMGAFNKDKGYTPFLDSLAQKSLFFTRAYANGRRSIEGIGAIYSGIPAMMDEPFISSEFATNAFFGLGTLMEEKKYDTSFFHGVSNGSMHFDSFMKSAGVSKYYGLNEYPDGKDSKDFDGTWGIFDGPYLQFFLDHLEKLPQPFFSGIFTLSSHQPFKLPADMVGQFPAGPTVNMETVQYVDQILKHFFDQVDKNPKFNNTLFIITSDHTSLSFRSDYEGEVGRYRVPLLFYMKNSPWKPQQIDDIAQHIDIIPTVMDMLGTPEGPRVRLSQSLLRPHEDKFFAAFFEGQYLYVNKNYFGVAERARELEVYSMEDRYKQNPIKDEVALQKARTQFRAALQYYSDGLWDRSLYFPATPQ